MLRWIRQRLGWKIFISYLLVIIVGIIVLAASTEFSIPSAFERHLAIMMPMMEGGGMGMGMMGTNATLEADLFTSFRNAVNEALARAALAAFLAALVVSWFISRQVVTPIREMMTASQHIAEGHYEQRVHVPGDPSEADELAQLAISFNRMAEKLAQTENMRRQLIGDISHELRTPLTTIKGSMEGLIDGVLPPTPETFLDIHREAERLQKLVSDLQELSRVEALAMSFTEGGASSLELAPLSMGRLVESVARRLSPQFDGKGVTLELEIPPSLPLVMADEDRIAQVLINLIGNALQYTPSGGKVWIQCAVQQLSKVSEQAYPGRNTARYLLTTIRDTGIGIPAEHLPHVFDRFYRVDKSRSRAGGGSGIGLTISKHIVEAHGGRIWAESEGPGKGSTFSFTLPVAQQHTT